MRTHGPGKTPGTGQRLRAADRTATPAPRMHAAVRRSAVDNVSRNPGQPLAAPLTEEMKARPGADFSRVPVHTDSADKDTLALQRSIGNAAVSQMLEQARYQYGAGRDHQQTAPAPVQRSAVSDVLSGPGQPLAAPLKDEMEARLGADFSQVRVHTGSVARASVACVGARAYTVGSHVAIGDGGADKHVLAHELTHVIQQRQGPVAGTDHGSGLKVSDPSDRDEQAAEANAVRVMGAPPTEHRLAAAAPRQLADEAWAAAIPPMQQVAKSSTDTNRALGAPVVQRVVNYSGPTIGVEQEIASGQKVVIRDENARKGPLGVVKKGDEVLVEFTADIGSFLDEYTIELKTTPTTKNAGAGTGLPEGIVDRQAAMKVMVGAILRAGAREGPVVPGTYGEYTIEIKKPNHRIRLAGRATSADPADEQVRFADQASMGVKTSDLGIGGNSEEVRLILSNAPWFDRSLESQLDSQGLTNAEQAKTVYALVASAIKFLHTIVESSDKVRVNEEGEIRGDLYNSSIKDKWGVLPRTPVWDWIKSLARADQGAVKGKLRSTYDKDPTKAAFKHIANSQDLAGHPVPASTIGGAQASVFEFRAAVPDSLKPYLYSSPGGEWELPSDLSERERHQAEELARNTQSPFGKAIAALLKRREEQDKVSEDEEEAGSEWDD